MKRMWIVLLGVVLVWGCAKDSKDPKPQDSQAEESQDEMNKLPVGTWYLYAGSETGSRTENLDKEVTILVLEDSTYTLTFMQPKIHLNFVERGQVIYDERNNQMKFSVFSSSGVDFSGSEPRKLVDVRQVVPWERDPGTVYLMSWETNMQFDDDAQVDREVLVLKSEGTEDSYFVRLQNRDAKSPMLDAQMEKTGP